MGNQDQTLQTIFDQAFVGIAQVGLDCAWLRVNNRYCQMLGYTESELRTKTLKDITHPDDYSKVLEGRHQLLEGTISAHSMEKRYIRRDGTIFWGRLNRSIVRDEHNQPLFFIVVVEDISQKVQIERVLRDREQQLVMAQNAGRVGLWDRDLRKNLTSTSGHYARLRGLPPNQTQITHEEWLAMIHPDDRERVQADLQECLEQTHIWDEEFRVVWPDGSVHWLLGKGQVFLDDSGLPVRMAGATLDITERKRVDEALRESEQRFRNMADAAPVMIWVTGPDKGATFFNKRCLDFTGHSMENKLGDGWVASLHPEDREQFLEVFSSSIDARQDFRSVFRLRRADGVYRWVLCNGVPRIGPAGEFSGYIGSCIDITDSRVEQEESFARQKLESLGTLASGIAHDFNNLLGGVLAQADLALEEFEAGSSPTDGLKRIRDVAIRGSEIVRELMIYAGKENATVSRVDLSKIVEEMLALLKVSVSKHVVLKADLGQNLAANASAAQLRQIVMNLVTNASDAIGDRDGVIEVITKRCSPCQEAAAVSESRSERDYLILEVSDTGCGMSQETQDRLFDPFFSTKSVGRGLGLAVVDGLVRGLGGAIRLTSELGKGTTFQILLPPAEITGRASSNGTSTVEELVSPSKRAAVLIVEDESVLRQAVAKMLRMRGFEVLEASDGSSAIALLRAAVGKIDLILLDMTIPGASSTEIVAEAARTRPNIRVVLTSAYSQEMLTAPLGAAQVRGFIRKPFQVGDLVRTLRHAASA
jgi:PAS domain S-box-containing protein